MSSVEQHIVAFLHRALELTRNLVLLACLLLLLLFRSLIAMPSHSLSVDPLNWSKQCFFSLYQRCASFKRVRFLCFFFLNKLLSHKILYYKLCDSQKELKNINAIDIMVAFEKLSFYLIVKFGIRLVNCSEAKQERDSSVFSSRKISKLDRNK